MYIPASAFTRTLEEREDQRLSWIRPDLNFFAAGACHILATEFLNRCPDSGYRIVCLRKSPTHVPHHVLVTNGVFVFDHNGYTRVEEARAVIEAEIGARGDVADLDLECVFSAFEGTLEAFCKREYHRLPEQFFQDPRPRAQAFLARFPQPEEILPEQ